MDATRRVAGAARPLSLPRARKQTRRDARRRGGAAGAEARRGGRAGRRARRARRLARARDREGAAVPREGRRGDARGDVPVRRVPGARGAAALHDVAHGQPHVTFANLTTSSEIAARKSGACATRTRSAARFTPLMTRKPGRGPMPRPGTKTLASLCTGAHSDVGAA